MIKPISNLKIYDLQESLVASGYPMITQIQERKVQEKDLKRANNLVKASNGNGAHGQFLTGIRVNFDLTFSNKAWVEAERYRFLQFVSSQSTMHRIAKFDIDQNCNQYVTDTIKQEINRLKEVYNNDPSKENYLSLLYNIPSGFMLTARMTTNYRCLLNIYIQRHDHRLPQWREFCNQLLEMPYFQDFVNSYNKI